MLPTGHRAPGVLATFNRQSDELISLPEAIAAQQELPVHIHDMHREPPATLLPVALLPPAHQPHCSFT
eukprot:12891583-Prorocentrum_lima.AAC.1